MEHWPAHGASLNDCQEVIRIAKLMTSEGMKPLPMHFDLSSADKNSELQSLSVWEPNFTPVPMALELMSVAPDNCFGLRLSVKDVRSINYKSRENDESSRMALNVVWDHDPREGAQGHAGITGLAKPPGMIKSEFKKVKIRLAEISDSFIISTSAQLDQNSTN